MYISQNTTIQLLHNVPLEPSYDHTFYFDSESKKFRKPPLQNKNTRGVKHGIHHATNKRLFAFGRAA